MPLRSGCPVIVTRALAGQHREPLRGQVAGDTLADMDEVPRKFAAKPIFAGLKVGRAQ